MPSDRPKPTAADFAAALARCLAAEEALEASMDGDDTEQAAEDSRARSALIALVRDATDCGPAECCGVILHDGRVITVTPEGDGLAIMDTGSVAEYPTADWDPNALAGEVLRTEEAPK